MPQAKRPSPEAVLRRMLQHLEEGEYDDRLVMLRHEVHARHVAIQEKRARHNMRTLTKVGTRVRISSGIRPQYLAGMTGSVVEKPEEFTKNRSDAIYVYLDHQPPTQKYGRTVGCPASVLEKE